MNSNAIGCEAFKDHIKRHWPKYAVATASVAALGVIALIVTTFAIPQTKDVMQNMWKTVGKSFREMNSLGIGLTVTASVIALAGLASGGCCTPCIACAV